MGMYSLLGGWGADVTRDGMDGERERGVGGMCIHESVTDRRRNDGGLWQQNGGTG